MLGFSLRKLKASSKLYNTSDSSLGEACDVDEPNYQRVPGVHLTSQRS